jgi:hypothetical protein
MSINFDATAGENVNHGSGASLDNLDTFSYLIWLRPKAVDQNAGLITKGTTGGANRRTLELRDTIVNTAIFFAVDRVTAPALAESTAAAYSANAWLFIAVAYNTSVAPQIYTGTLTTSAAEVSYNSQDAGSGATGDNNANNQFVGAFGAGTTGNPNADIAWVGIWNRKLSSGEIAAQQFRPRVTSGSVLFTHYGYNGLSTQPDWSGNGNNGTVTGTPPGAADHVPLGPFFGADVGYVPYVVAAPAGGSILRQMLMQGLFVGAHA